MHKLTSIALALVLSTPALATSIEAIDLRADRWKRTSVVNFGSGVVQYTGDDTKYGSFATMIEKRIRIVSGINQNTQIELKTADVRLSLPDARIDDIAVNVARHAVPQGAAFAPAFAALFSKFSKDKVASAVFCVSIDGKNFLGNNARLFRYGAEEELDASIEAALKVPEQSIQSGAQTESPACEPGWEGGQPRSD